MSKGTVFLIGRWQGLTPAHVAFIQYPLDHGYNVVVGVRDTAFGQDDPFSAEERVEILRKEFGGSIDVVVIPDITEVWVGRDVGYKVVKLSDKIEDAKYSGTKLRSAMRAEGIL